MMNAKFNNIINSNKPVLVDFYADWCVPCKQVPNILKEVKETFKDGIRIIKVNVDKYPIIATKYKIRNLPTVILFKDGVVKWTACGLISADEIKSTLKHCLEISSTKTK